MINVKRLRLDDEQQMFKKSQEERETILKRTDDVKKNLITNGREMKNMVLRHLDRSERNVTDKSDQNRKQIVQAEKVIKTEVEGVKKNILEKVDDYVKRSELDLIHRESYYLVYHSTIKQSRDKSTSVEKLLSLSTINLNKNWEIAVKQIYLDANPKSWIAKESTSNLVLIMCNLTKCLSNEKFLDRTIHIDEMKNINGHVSKPIFHKIHFDKKQDAPVINIDVMICNKNDKNLWI